MEPVPDSGRKGKKRSSSSRLGAAFLETAMSCQRSIILQVPGLRPSLADPLRVGNWFSRCPVCSVGTRPQQFLASSSSSAHVKEAVEKETIW
ncbi:hypothetical protein D6C95_04956 [Aureobasidium pullulans]|nr:hypothetical protein D6C95_04956 [Aureobasidium pullulans]